MSSRRKAREFALQLFFQQDLAQNPANQITELFWRSNAADDETRHFAEFLFHEGLSHKAPIDAMIKRHTLHWRMDRMAAVDRNILRMAVTEFLFAGTPKVVVIDEAIEIARKYSGDDSTEFVNGVLDAIRTELEEGTEKEDDDGKK
jgi:transcription antitermination protein NusB